jgi:hypothetical protein
MGTVYDSLFRCAKIVIIVYLLVYIYIVLLHGTRILESRKISNVKIFITDKNFEFILHILPQLMQS